MIMYPQHLPHYKHDFEKFVNWKIKETSHYIFHFIHESVAEKEIDQIIKIQEAAFTKITEELELPFPEKKIQYYLYSDAELKKKLMGDDWYAQSIYNEFRIHVLYTNEDKPIGPHEDTHLLSLPWGLSWNFLQEGLAEYMVGHCWDGVPHVQKVREGIEKGIDLSPTSQLSTEDWLNTADKDAIYYYALAGSWANYLINEFGLPKFKALYQNTDRQMPAGKIRQKYVQHIGREITDLENAFLKSVINSEMS